MLLYLSRSGSGEIFPMKVQGDSMRDARIFDGDLVLVKVQREALPGEIVVARKSHRDLSETVGVELSRPRTVAS